MEYENKVIKNWLISGDKHGSKEYLRNIDKSIYKPEETAIIVLGDAGLNFWRDSRDKRLKDFYQKSGFTFYLVRGNHEERPENIDTMVEGYDIEVCNDVFFEEKYPNIKYLEDGYIYHFGQYSALIVGGAYSVDKYYRLQNEPRADGWTGWFKDEQLTEEEMARITLKLNVFHVDFILSHTCPYKWRPTDLFLNCVNQETVDSSMELWMDELTESDNWNIWLWAHYHADRIERPHCEMYYNAIEDLDTIYKRWVNYDNTGKLDWYLRKGPMFYAK